MIPPYLTFIDVRGSTWSKKCIISNGGAAVAQSVEYSAPDRRARVETHLAETDMYANGT